MREFCACLRAPAHAHELGPLTSARIRAQTSVRIRWTGKVATKRLKMKLLNNKTIIKLLITLWTVQVAHGFWLTDGSLFQQPEVANQSGLASEVIAANRIQQQQQQASKLAKQVENNIQAQQLAQAGVTTVQACQCNSEWLQASANQWLQSEEFAKYLRQSIVWLSANGSSSTSITGAGKRQQESARSLAWNKPANNKRNGSSAAAAAANNQRPARTNNRPAPPPPPPVKLVPGPKGERGPPGERGPSGERLISVKDRDGLFDLAPTQSGTEVKRKEGERRLAFVESEQLLVVETSLGWRPVQMLAPLRDFRKSIAKFSLQTGEQRRRLLTGGASGQVLEIVGADEDEDDDNDDDDDDGDDAINKITVDDDEDDEEGEQEEEEQEEEEDEEDDDDDNQISTIQSKANEKAKRRRAQVSSRSALAPRVTSEAERVMKLRLVALNEPFAGNQHGLRGANFECKRQAARANVRGAFRALLATNYQNLNEIVRHNAHVHKFPIVNLRGETLANSWHELFRAPTRMANPLSRLVSFDGRHVASDPKWPNKLVWHGAGNKLGLRDPTHNCDGWHSDSLAKFGFATPLHSPKGHAHAAKKVHLLEELIKYDIEGHNSSSSGSTAAVAQLNSKGPLVFDVIEKYPCRMPLIVLCIETIAQSID